MPSRPFFAALLAMLPVLCRAEVSVPNTPPGRALAAWLEAFNSGDPARLASFTQTYSPAKNPDSYMRWREDVGGYDLLEIYSGDQTNVFFRVKARANGAEEVGRVTVSATDPRSVTGIGAWHVVPGGTFEAVILDAAARDKVVGSVADMFDRFYVTPGMGKKISVALRKRNADGEYRDQRFGDAFAQELTQDLQAISHDKHAEVRFSYFVKPVESPEKQSDAEARRLAADNCGFEKAEHLPPNIGYLKLDGFADANVCGATASAAMNFVADSNALILDLRDNRGGGGGMVEFIASYLFKERTHLDDFFSRGVSAASETWTLPYVPGRKFIGKPVFVLTSSHTFSAAEALTYYLKSLKRATVVGETTPGGGHITEARPIDDHFTARVPYGRSVSPITQGSWEGTGVEPDVKVAADQALDAARKLAAEETAGNR